ncbi:hypothetical protein HD597_011131 [Nonomuraea thailandensis]|uniref:Uncharacterized protein n=1 Tax=Nonomuraea thailandensis TaxID=1188745 RepID=A0A9X2GYH2_9ACTN|nr:hypothetical protein [Nonomuraea thailandensis]MCP2364111.1 hypothetical protein [Nonomuraea thailandensis]
MGAKVVAVVALILIGSGLLTGFLPVTSGGQACGSAFAEAAPDETAIAFYPDDGCTDVRSLVRIPAIVLLAAGGATLCAAGMLRWRISLARG